MPRGFDTKEHPAAEYLRHRQFRPRRNFRHRSRATHRSIPRCCRSSKQVATLVRFLNEPRHSNHLSVNEDVSPGMSDRTNLDALDANMHQNGERMAAERPSRAAGELAEHRHRVPGDRPAARCWRLPVGPRREQARPLGGSGAGWPRDRAPRVPGAGAARTPSVQRRRYRRWIASAGKAAVFASTSPRTRPCSRDHPPPAGVVPRLAALGLPASVER